MPPLRHAYVHGFASSSLSYKGQALRRFYASHGREFLTPDLNAPSFAKLTYTDMLAAVDAFDQARDEAESIAPGRARWRIVGSSMGGYLAARWAELHPERVDELILLCPAFDFTKRWPSIIGEEGFARWREQGHFSLPDGTGTPVDVHYGLVEDAQTHPARPVVPCPTTIVHGTRDTVVPIELSREYAAAHAHVALVEVDDDHTLAQSLPQIEALVLSRFINPRPQLCWDFRGPPAAGTAEHFLRHLDEFLAREGFEGCETGVEVPSPGVHAFAWCRCAEDQVAAIGRALRPHRVES